MFNSTSRRKMMLSCISLLGLFVTATNNAWAQACSQDCLRVYSVDLRDLGTYINGTVKLWDETGSAGGARSAVVHGVWTRPDGSSFDQYANIGTRLRAEFRLYTAGAPGVYTLTVVGATKAGYTFDPENSNLIQKSIGEPVSANQLPIAISNADAISGTAPLTVSFDSGGSMDPDGTVSSYYWDFGDDSSSTDMYPIHTYGDIGNFTATLTVTDNEGATASNSISIVVTGDIAGCSVNCMSVDRVAMSYKAAKGRVKGQVWLLDENNNAVQDATVHGQWTLPDNSTVDQYRDIGAKSRANFSLAEEGAGLYTLTIVEVTKAGHIFDPDNSNVLGGDIAISP